MQNNQDSLKLMIMMILYPEVISSNLYVNYRNKLK
jgi:hypothetical protein